MKMWRKSTQVVASILLWMLPHSSCLLSSPFLRRSCVLPRQLFTTLLTKPTRQEAAISMMSSSSSSLSPFSSDLAVVGCGVLGTSLCRQVLGLPPGSRDGLESFTAITKTTNRHESIRSEVLGEGVGDGDGHGRFFLASQDDLSSREDGGGACKFKHVVFCAPPSGFDDYPSAVERAADELWLGPSGGGVFVFTSSGGVYEGKEGETVTESSPTCNPESSPRVGRIVTAERTCLKKGGTVLRLAGLYTLQRGAHNYWLTSGKDVQGRPDGIVNLLHYDDAAGACVAALQNSEPEKLRGKVFLISDGNPTTRRGICESALKHSSYEGYTMPNFVGGDGDPLGKVYDGSWSNSMLNWKPRFSSFDEFMVSI